VRRAGVRDETAEDLDGSGETVALGVVERGDVGAITWARRARAVRSASRPDPVIVTRTARVVGVGLAADPAFGLQPLDLVGHRGLGAVVGGRERRDASGALLLDLRQQPRLGVRDVEAGPLRHQPVQAGHYLEEVGAQLLGRRLGADVEADRQTINLT
jgi:hypothetical protein